MQLPKSLKSAFAVAATALGAQACHVHAHAGMHHHPGIVYVEREPRHTHVIERTRVIEREPARPRHERKPEWHSHDGRKHRHDAPPPRRPAIKWHKKRTP